MLNKLFELLREGVKKGVFPGAVAGVSYKNRRYIVGAGYKSITPFTEPVEEEDIFDLASLTKPLALAFTFMYLEEVNPKINLIAPIGDYLTLKKELSEIPIYRFFNHTSGLKAWYPFYKDLYKDKIPNKLKKLVKILETLPLEYEPGTKSVYSDLGYFLLTYLLEEVYCRAFEELFSEVKKVVFFSRKAFLDFKPLEKGIDQERIAPTSVCPWEKKLLRGVVEDENTRAIGGVSGVAGLFGNIYGILDMLEFLLSAYKGLIREISSKIISRFIDLRETLSEYALGFMLPSKEEKRLLNKKISEFTIKHTGFTGCSFFMDLEKEVIVVLLSNRVHPDRENTKIRSFRPYFHKEVFEALFK